MRDDFKPKTIESIARRVNYLCSNPQCRRPTVGPRLGNEGTINVGVAAHITAASAGGPRYDAALSADERRHESNGIWLCQTHSKLIDSDEERFTVELLREWKRTAEERIFAAIASAPDCLDYAAKITVELDDADRELIRGLGLPSQDDIEAVTLRLRSAAKTDVQAFKGVRVWPRHSISLNLRTRDSSGVHTVSVAGMAAAIDVAREVSLIAPPGTGKTTTLVQVADAILSSDTAVAAFVPFAEWSSRTDSIFQSLTRRNAFQGFREQHFMLLAYHGRLVLLLDGWNELDPASRTRAIHELSALRRDYPQLGIVVSTRRQARDVPVSGPTIEIEALSEKQQLEMARAIRGRDGEALLDQVWRTPGVSELISIPLYLNALLSSATSGTMPTTKEEVLRLFVTEHEKSPDRVDVLERELLGFHREFLEALAVEATQVANTIIQDGCARKVISETEDRLVTAGQIKNPAEPKIVLETLVSHYLLIRSERNSGVSFQHQQFQEWYASFEVERLMLAASAGDGEAGKKLAVDMLDMPAWEESILFACDRLARADETRAKAVAAAILRALSIDPMLAAEMIYRASTAVWNIVKKETIAFVGRWHKPSTVDRAVRFMITTGKPEFAPQIWPLVTNPDREVHLSVLRAAHQFRPSVLGPDAQMRITKLPEEVREHVIPEIASRSGMDGIELATSLAKTDASTAVQCAVIEALQFRRADRFVIDILKVASDDVWKLLARKGYADEIEDEEAAARLRSERQSYVESEANMLVKIGALLEQQGNNDPAVAHQIARLIESENFPVKDSRAAWTLERVFARYPQEVGEALLQRIKMGRELPFQGEELLKDIATIDEGAIPRMVIDCTHENRVADKAAVVVGSKTVGILIDRFLAHEEKMRTMEQPIDKRDSRGILRLKGRISASRIEAFLPALQNHSDTEDPYRISILADLLALHGKEVETRPLQAEPGLLEPIVDMVKHWVDVMLASPQANRHQFAKVARAIERLPRPEFVEGLRRFLAEDLLWWPQARQDFSAKPECRPYLPGVRYSYTLKYQRAFAAIGDEQVVLLMEQYLPDLTFGLHAARVLKDIWDKQQNIPEEKLFRSWPDFSEVKLSRRERQEQGVGNTSSYAEAIFKVVKRKAQPEGTEADRRHALQLAKIGLSMPHGDQSSVIETLLALPQSSLEKCDLLASLVLTGEIINAEMVLDGLRQLLEEAKQKPWLLDEQHNGVEQWFELLPFSERPAALHDGLALVDKRFREPGKLRRLLSVLGNTPDTRAEQLLEELADNDPRFYSEYDWLQAIISRGTASSVRMLLSLICGGKLTAGNSRIDGSRFARDLASMIRNHPEMRTELIRCYEGQAAGFNKSIIEHAIAELADADGLLALVQGYARDKRIFDGTLHHLIEEVALGREPLPDWGGNAYNLHSVNVADLRKRLFMMLDATPEEAGLAEACLTAIDELRDEHGRIDSEPRHPDIMSSRPWPLAAANFPDC